MLLIKNQRCILLSDCGYTITVHHQHHKLIQSRFNWQTHLFDNMPLKMNQHRPWRQRNIGLLDSTKIYYKQCLLPNRLSEKNTLSYLYANAIRWFGCTLDTLHYDFFYYAHTPHTCRLQLITTPKKSLVKKIDMLKQVGIKLHIIDTDLMALTRLITLLHRGKTKGGSHITVLHQPQLLGLALVTNGRITDIQVEHLCHSNNTYQPQHVLTKLLHQCHEAYHKLTKYPLYLLCPGALRTDWPTQNHPPIRSIDTLFTPQIVKGMLNIHTALALSGLSWGART